eukprot:CCRYP_005600-RA/>CCRYP_005600-RA protein AED:0.09 eAED:0.09 QI:0/-1/0/1/-1/1/1/0/348
MSTRCSLSRRAKEDTLHNPSLLQCKLERATDSPGGIQKIFHLIHKASNNDIHLLNEHQWTPLVGAIFRLGKNTTRHGNSPTSEQELIDLIEVSHQRGLSLNSKGFFAQHVHRPITIAAYFGFHRGVRRMLQLGALPDLTDGEGKTAWHNSFQNPCATGSAVFRECDRLTATALLDEGVVTSDLRVWRLRNSGSQRGTVCHVNVESLVESPLYHAVENRRLDVVKFIVDKGGTISDRGFLIFHFRGKKRRFLEMAIKVGSLPPKQHVHLNSLRTNKDWSFPSEYWSYPPTWKVGVILCQNCGLPPDIFEMKVVPFLAHDWFFTKHQLTQKTYEELKLPLRQSASLEILS